MYVHTPIHTTCKRTHTHTHSTYQVSSGKVRYICVQVQLYDVPVVRVCQYVQPHCVTSRHSLLVGHVEREVVGTIDQVGQDQDRFGIRAEQRDLWSHDNHMRVT